MTFLLFQCTSKIVFNLILCTIIIVNIKIFSADAIFQKKPSIYVGSKYVVGFFCLLTPTVTKASEIKFNDHFLFNWLNTINYSIDITFHIGRYNISFFFKFFSYSLSVKTAVDMCNLYSWGEAIFLFIDYFKSKSCSFAQTLDCT